MGKNNLHEASEIFTETKFLANTALVNIPKPVSWTTGSCIVYISVYNVQPAAFLTPYYHLKVCLMFV